MGAVEWQDKEMLEAPMTGLLSGTLAGGPLGSFFLSRVFFL